MLGPDGARKTTFVRAVATLLRPDAGTLHVDGIDALQEPARVRQVIGLAGQFAAVEEAMTGRENVCARAIPGCAPGRRQHRGQVVGQLPGRGGTDPRSGCVWCSVSPLNGLHRDRTGGRHRGGTAQAAQSLDLAVTPLVVRSSACVPVGSMPTGVKQFGENQPLTPMADAVRSLATGPGGKALLAHSTSYHVGLSLVWAAAIFVVFGLLAVLRFARR